LERQDQGFPATVCREGDTENLSQKALSLLLFQAWYFSREYRTSSGFVF